MMKLFKKKKLRELPTEAENCLQKGGSIILLTFASHGYEFRLIICFLRKITFFVLAEEMSDGTLELATQVSDVFADCKRNGYDAESRKESGRVGTIRLYFNNEKFETEFSRSTVVLKDSPLNRLLNELGNHFPIHVDM